MARVRRYEVYKYAAPLFVGIYFVVVIVGMGAFHQPELFPFFNWSLFSNSYSERSDAVIRLDSINGKSLPSSRLYYEMSDIFRYAKDRDSFVSKVVTRLANAIRAGDEPTISELRKLIEGRFMAEIKSAEYDVVELTYDPIERLRKGKVKDAVVLATYEKVPRD
jgi:hypothetical protein